MEHFFSETVALNSSNDAGLDRDWYGRSSWGSSGYTRKSVCQQQSLLRYREGSDFLHSQAHRRELLDILTSFIPIENVKFSKRLTKIEQHVEGAVLHFADGEIVQASLVVGADGIQSIVRKHVLQPLFPDEVEPIYADSYAYRAVISMSEAKEILGDLTDTAKMYVGQDRNVVTYRISGGDVSQIRLDLLHEALTALPAPGIQLPSLRI